MKRLLIIFFLTASCSMNNDKLENNISDIVNSSGLSRSSVYKTLKKLVDRGTITLIQSDHDKREFLVRLS